MSDTAEYIHPSFVRAAELAEPLRSHFPKSVDEARAFEPMQRYRALDSKVLVVAQTRVECAWRAYIAAVSGMDHRAEIQAVADYGTTLHEPLARLLFPEFNDIPYAD